MVTINMVTNQYDNNFNMVTINMVTNQYGNQSIYSNEHNVITDQYIIVTNQYSN